MNNFSAASAIVAALMSPKVATLILGCEDQTIQIVHTLNRDLSPASGAYYDTLRQAGTKELIPWLGTIGPLVFLTTDLPRLSQTPTCLPSTQPLLALIPLLRWTDTI
jgi:hypothetical protein